MRIAALARDERAFLQTVVAARKLHAHDDGGLLPQTHVGQRDATRLFQLQTHGLRGRVVFRFDSPPDRVRERPESGDLSDAAVVRHCAPAPRVELPDHTGVQDVTRRVPHHACADDGFAALRIQHAHGDRYRRLGSHHAEIGRLSRLDDHAGTDSRGAGRTGQCSVVRPGRKRDAERSPRIDGELALEHFGIAALQQPDEPVPILRRRPFHAPCEHAEFADDPRPLLLEIRRREYRPITER